MTYLLAIIICCLSNCLASAEVMIQESPKEDLFLYPKPYLVCNGPLKNEACDQQCAYMKVHFNRNEHVVARDVEPGYVTKPDRIQSGSLEKHKIEIPYTGGSLSTYEVGTPKNKECKFAVVFVHGSAPQKGDLGVSDVMFGGNFNHLQHLVADNHGVYYSPSVEFDESGEKGVASLLKYIQKNSCPKAKTVIACASAGSEICWRIANSNAVEDLSGIIITGGAPLPRYELKNSKAVQVGLPITILHGEDDFYEPWEKLYKNLRAQDAMYPIRFVLFKDGAHGTPIRMVNWKSALNCVFAQSRDKASAPAPIPALAPSAGAQ